MRRQPNLTLIIFDGGGGGGQVSSLATQNLVRKRPCPHHNNTAMIKQIDKFDNTLVMTNN